MRALGILALAACGTDPAGPPPTLLEQLAAMPGVADVAQQPSFTPGYDYYILHFTQLVDHANPNGGSFLQEVSLHTRDVTAPTVYFTTGYDDYEGDYLDELADFLSGNQVSIEHRYFGTSVPDPDFSYLTIRAAADDEHAIATAFQTLYTGASLASGHSKGGETALFYRRFYPDDVDGTVAYVAPINLGNPDQRYQAWLGAIGTAACRDHLHALAVEMLSNRRAALETRASAAAADLGLTYHDVPLGPAVEAAVTDLSWSFWQYHGIQFCTNVMPEVTDDDDKLYTYLDSISPVSANSDQSIQRFAPYYYQAAYELGYPDEDLAYLAPYLIYTGADYNYLRNTPIYDQGSAMGDVQRWVASSGDRLMLVYGGFDPWTGGALQLGAATDSRLLTVDQGSHNANLRRLSDADRAAAFADLERWTGVAPMVTPRLAEPPRPHLPHLLLR